MALIRNNLDRTVLDAALGQPVFSLTTIDRDDTRFQFATTPLVDGKPIEVETIITGQGLSPDTFLQGQVTTFEAIAGGKSFTLSDIDLGVVDLLNSLFEAPAASGLKAALGDDDRIIGARQADRFNGFAGDDLMRGRGGDDTLRGGGGEDTLVGGGGDDILRGGGGADRINGGGGADRLFGGGGADTLRGNGGDDMLKGNGGADVFQFRASDRNDTISDFRQGQDKIQILSGASRFEALTIEQDGADVLIGFGAGYVRVITDTAEAFDESDFIF